MSVVVMKFGGTSVGDVPRIRHVASLVTDYKQRHPDEKIVVVVSAMSGETNKLIALAKSCVEKPEPRELDVILSTGEQVTIALTAMALIAAGSPAKSLIAVQACISTDRTFTNAQIKEIDTTAVTRILEDQKIAVVAGFQGVDDQGNLTTLGRGGSDITAVALAAALSAKACYIYTDVAGVYSTDPRVCKSSVLLKRVCHEEMLEMASLGAKVLHPRSVYFAMRYHVPLVVLSTFTPGPGTWIVEEKMLMEKPVVTGVTYRTDEAKITVTGLKGGIKALSSLFTMLADENIFIDMITHSLVKDTGEDSTANVSFTVADEVSSRALNLALDALPTLGASGAALERDIAKVSVIGIGMKYHTGVAAKMFSALAAEDIDVEMIGTSEIKISVVIARKYSEIAVRTLHETFIEHTPEIVAEN